ncbi:MAG: hypothetical protein ACRDGS_04765, partial [Chloroflexota bacterium]
MLIRDIFATTITERIEPVVKVVDRAPAVVTGELTNLVVTHLWERYLHQILDAYANAADRDDEQGIGIWISGFFGSGKSLLMKIAGVLLAGGELGPHGVHELFLARLPSGSPDRGDIERFLAICTRKIVTKSVGGNLHTMQGSPQDPLALIVFKLFAVDAGYTHDWPFAWAVEYAIDQRNLSDQFRRRAESLCGKPWKRIAADSAMYSTKLHQAACDTMPEVFEDLQAVERAIKSVLNAGGITPKMVIDRLREWCVARDLPGKRQKIYLQLDELGQWLRGGATTAERTMQVQALAEAAATAGAGRIWLAVTAHGDVQELSKNVQQAVYAQINQRFTLRCKLSNDDIGLVVEERLLRKNQADLSALTARFQQDAGLLADLGTLANPQHAYPVPTADTFALFYPYLPWT